MITLADFFDDQVLQGNSGYVDDVLEKYMREKRIPNSKYDTLYTELMLLIINKPEVNFEQKTGRYIVKNLKNIHPITEKLENVHSQITGHILGSITSENFSDFITNKDIEDSFKRFQIENIINIGQKININLKDDELEFYIDICKHFYTIKTRYILTTITKSIIPYFEYLNGLNGYEFHRKCHLPLDYGLYSVFEEIQKLFTQKFDNIIFKINTFDQNQ